MNRPRCPRGHFLPAAGTCRCTRPRIGADLWGQGRRIRSREMTTVDVVGGYL
ncbi:hypothetical protein GCM10018980_51380 [Streptomyces capoamus]|uniref:Uncharacterized protein n=1 Tax=Streptomyces capoamus TaxID=68183 RepID=A0A919EZL5_9ACTN|nr:hypothetical protein [Streptomyces capoamus]GGW15823.1 hypothetical protein GCM10010501_29430 [Streptomyces libani subsp. rufus]GHG61880.1 hypothetical protein GCM10018980_51380 [Streptomyces capoamus]